MAFDLKLKYTFSVFSVPVLHCLPMSFAQTARHKWVNLYTHVYLLYVVKTGIWKFLLLGEFTELCGILNAMFLLLLLLFCFVCLFFPYS